MAPYTPTSWQNTPSTATPLSAANLNKLTDELEAQASEAGVVNPSLPTWANGATPALTDSAPWNALENVVEAVALSVGLTYTKTAWSTGWTPARNAARLNKLETQAAANRIALDTTVAPRKTLNRFTDFTIAWNKFTTFQTDPWATAPPYTAWPNGGGIFEVDTPHGPGIRYFATPDMLYTAILPDEVKLARLSWGSSPSSVSFMGRREVWECHFRFLSSENPSGIGDQSIFTVGTTLTGSQSPNGHVGHELQTFVLGGVPKWRFARTLEAPESPWGNAHDWVNGPTIVYDTWISWKMEIFWTESASGYLRVYTDGVNWLNYSGPTVYAQQLPWGLLCQIYRGVRTANNGMTIVNLRITEV